MIDIVEQLRVYWDDGFTIHPPRKIDLEAANEIEQLRAQLIRATAADADLAEKEPGAPSPKEKA